MKKTTLIFFFALIINALSFAQTHITDKNFANAIKVNCSICIDANDNLTASADTLQSLILNSLMNKLNTIEGIQGFKNLKYLNCSRNYYITSLPPLPQSLKYLDCSINSIVNVSAFPENLVSLNCSNNLIKILPNIAQGVTILDCSGNKLTTLPTLPQGLKKLSCTYNQLTTLPTLPQGLTELYCGDCQLITLPTLPQELTMIQCPNNQLVTLPNLPANLKYLFCSNNKLNTLPALPNTLTFIDCINNKLTILPALSKALTSLLCSNNQLNALPILPQKLTILYCNTNQLALLPALPQSLKELECSYNKLVNLPKLPQSLTKLSCAYNKISCFGGWLPPKLSDLQLFNTEIKCLPNKPTGLNSALPICDAKSSYDCFYFPIVNGNIFLDYNDDGVKNDDDVYVSSQMIETAPYNSLTNANGNYFLRIDTAKSSTMINLKNISDRFDVKPAQRKINVTDAYAQTYNNQDFRLVPKEIFGDIELSIVSSVQRPGFAGTLTLTYRNIRTTVLNGKIKLEKDPILTFLSAVPKEDIIEGNTITWDYSNLKPFETRNIYVDVKVATTTKIGTILNNKMFATFNILNNYYETEKVVENTIIVSSYDPNDKTAHIKSLSPKDITDRKSITYTIRFQNTGTYHAERVEVQDTISPLFDLSTLKTIALSHPNCQVNIETDRFKKGQPTVVKWIFENILLPDSSANEMASHGFIRYSIQPKQGLPIGTSLENKAYIYFDYNLPIITNISKVKVAIPSKTQEAEATIPLKIYPNPSSDRISVSTSADVQGELFLSNLFGQIVDYQLFNQNETSVFDLHHLPKGVYALTLKTAQGNVTELVVKQ
jgi:Leucine-rich repeat (LRR) protein